MLKKFLFSLGLFFTLFIATSANAGWKANSDFSAVYDYKIKGKVAARYLGIPQYPQPTNYTCGATTMSMLMLWETHKKGRGIKFGPLAIHNYVNAKDPKGETSGLTTTELKSGINKLIKYVKDKYKLPLNMIMSEYKNKTIKDGISRMMSYMRKNFSPAIIYGNVNILPSRKGYQIVPGAMPGGHYYLVTGMVYCPKGYCTKDVFGLFINDSVYNSNAWDKKSTIRKVAVTPRKLILAIDLKNYWLPVGDKLPWKRGHMFLYNSNSKA
jgi:hypothetical protein